MKEMLAQLSRYRVKMARTGRLKAKDELDALIFAVSKQVAVKVEYKSDIILDYKFPVCPCCNGMLSTKNAAYCDKCGQALEWG